MYSIYRTTHKVLTTLTEFTDGAWVQLVSPSLEECTKVAEQYEIDITDLRAALDDEESSRISLEDNYTLVLVDVPSREERNNRDAYTTIPLGIILHPSAVITVCAEDTSVLRQFVDRRVRDFSTKKQMRFLYQILYNTCLLYQSLLRSVDRKRTEIEEKIDGDMEDSDLFDLHELESNLVYFATSLQANGVVLDRLRRYGRLKMYEEDKDLLEDVVIENRQAIEMTGIYRDILRGTRELLSTIINNRMNDIMKYLAAITIVMAIPTIVSGLWGMNVPVPLAVHPFGFVMVVIGTLAVCGLTIYILHRKRML